MEDSVFVYSRPSLQWTKYWKHDHHIDVDDDGGDNDGGDDGGGDDYCQNPLPFVCK